MSEYLLVLTTLPDEEAAQAMAERLVRERLAACVNISAPVTSVFEWQGKVTKEREILLTIKTRQARFDALRETIVATHPYELPEVIAVPITAALPAYLAWIETCTDS